MEPSLSNDDLSSTTIFPAMKLHPPASSPSYSSSRRRRYAPFSISSSLTSSSSSSSSSLVSSGQESPITTPNTPCRFSGIPFSWEQIPGIPKEQVSSICSSSSSLKILPLPPPTTVRAHQTAKKKFSPNSVKDPFVAALVECSKEEDDDAQAANYSVFQYDKVSTSAKIARSLSDRFGFVNFYTSCKRTCAVSESIIHLPRPMISRSNSSYDLISHRSP